jgi:hypothetical protein
MLAKKGEMPQCSEMASGELPTSAKTRARSIRRKRSSRLSKFHP